jgi:flagellar biosynthesis/type III secretory pathway M-ring protein FliF/YscJ
MPTWLWIVIAAAALLLLVLLVWGGRRGRERRLGKKRSEAAELRTEAQQRLGQAGQREAVAQQEAERARRERLVAEDAARRADDIDPDTPDVSEDAEPYGNTEKRDAREQPGARRTTDI